MFWNCLNLDEHSLVAIGLNTQINVIKFANHHLSTLNHDHVENYNDYDYADNYHSYQAIYVYPGSSVPEWLDYKTRKDYIIIDLSSAPPSSQLGFIFCFVLGKYQNRDAIERFEFNIIISDAEGEGKKDSVSMYIDFHWVETIESDHVYVMYDQRCCGFLNSRAKTQTRFKLQVIMWARLFYGRTYHALPQEVLKGFGVSPISTSAYISFVQQMELRDSLYHFH
ncbi:hypothetical protein E2542_SST01490 [Spatholobus suberectus]|nr:hypothetical protein E2542_SST01490 [Spatholobus suberectus]